METIAGYQVTGRRLKGPAADLIELTGEQGQKLTAVSFHPEYRQHRAINSSLEVVVRFLEEPMVQDLVELSGRDESEGAFVYPTGQVWAVADVIRILADLGETAGVRAGLELMHSAGQVLSTAADFGASDNVYSHGGLTPWRLVMRQDGRVLVIGHALPQVEILMFHEDHTVVPPSDSFRYCPPERIHGEEEDLSSDLFSLCLIAFEFMTGKPVYDGLVNDIRQKAARGDATNVIFRVRDRLPKSVRDILGKAMSDAHGRFETGTDFLEATASALSSGDATGPSLAEVMRKVSSQMQRRGVVPDSASTVMGTPEEIRAMLDDEEEVTGSAREVWQPTKKAAPAAPEPAIPEPEPAIPDPDVPARGRRWSAATRRSGVRSPGRAEAPAPPAEPRPAQSRADGQPKTDGDKPRWKSAGVRRSGVRRATRGAPSSEPAQEALAADPATPAVESAPGVDIQKVLRSSRVRSPRRGRAPVRQAPAAEPSASNETPMAPAERLAAPTAQEAIPDSSLEARSSTADLLARIRQSASRSRASTVDGGSAAGALIEQLVRSSDRRGGAPSADPSKAESPTPDVASAREGGGRSRRVRRVRRGGQRTEAPKAVAAPQPASNEAIPVAGPPPPVDAGLPIASGPAPVASLEVEPSADLPVPTEPDVNPSPGAVNVPVAPPAPTVPASAANEGESKELHSVPTPASTRSQASTVNLLVRCGPADEGTRRRFPKSDTAADAIRWIAVNLVPIRMDLTGRLTGWFRLHQDGKQVPPTTPLAELDPALPLVVHTVPNEVRLVDIRVEAPSEARFMAPVGTAVPVVTLVDHLTSWLELPAGDYTLHSAQGPLQPHGILADLLAETDSENPPGRLQLILRQGASE